MKKKKATATTGFFCSRKGGFDGLSLTEEGGGCSLQSVLGSGGASSASACVTHRGVTTLTHTLPIGKMEHESACPTLQ